MTTMQVTVNKLINTNVEINVNVIYLILID